MKRFTLTHLLLFVTWCGIACVVGSQYLATMPYTGATHDNAGATFYDYTDDERFASSLEQELVRASPAWNPRQANPPISAREALAIAERLRRQRLRDLNGWKWGLDALTLYPLDGANNKWCWRVSFSSHPEDGNMAGSVPQFSAFVLMDGTVVPPKTESYQSQLGVVPAEEVKTEATE